MEQATLLAPHGALETSKFVAFGQAVRFGRMSTKKPPLLIGRCRRCWKSSSRGASYGRRAATLVHNSGAMSSAVATELPPGATAEDVQHMKRAAELARKALGRTSPNPMVGCVIVKDGQVVGEGFHPKAGEPHAEVFALREAGKLAQGATAYVSLEPCNHFGRTPPCSQALVKARVKRVVVGMQDPNPQVAGKGVQTLRRAGIEVVVGVEEEACQRNVEAFVCRMLNKRPFLTLRFTMSLDGKLLSLSHLSTSEGSTYSLLLAESDAVVISSAALPKPPSATPASSSHLHPCFLSSEPDAKQPLRVVVADSLVDLWEDAAVFDVSTDSPTLVVTTQGGLTEGRADRTGLVVQDQLISKGVEVLAMNEIRLEDVVDLCYQRGANSVLWDVHGLGKGGVELGKLVVEGELYDKVSVTMAPIFAGKEGVEVEFMPDGLPTALERLTCVTSGECGVVEGYVRR